MDQKSLIPKNAFVKSISNHRFERYLRYVNNDVDRALRLYTYNALISQAFYIPLQGLEVTLRNAINLEMVKAYGDFWFERSLVILETQASDVQKVKNRISYEKKNEKNPATHDRIVAGLTFGFWIGMLGPKYDELWKKVLFRIVTKREKGIKRKTFSSSLKVIRDLRNRVAHHECILESDLKSVYESILYLTGLLSESSKLWIEENANVDEILSNSPPYKDIKQ